MAGNSLVGFLDEMRGDFPVQLKDAGEVGKVTKDRSSANVLESQARWSGYMIKTFKRSWLLIRCAFKQVPREISTSRLTDGAIRFLSYSPRTQKHYDIPRPKSSNGDIGFHLTMSVYVGRVALIPMPFPLPSSHPVLLDTSIMWS